MMLDNNVTLIEDNNDVIMNSIKQEYLEDVPQWKLYYESHKDICKKACKNYYNNNKEKIIQYTIEYNKQNKETRNKTIKEKRNASPEAKARYNSYMRNLYHRNKKLKRDEAIITC